jgi:hypothetical protein
LLKSKRRGWWLVGFLVVALPIVFSIVGGNMVPCVDHLKYEDWWDKEYPKEWWQGKKIVVNPRRWDITKPFILTLFIENR